MRYLPALILDAVLVLVFAVIGRASHDEDPAGFLLTAWPFLVALLAGHAVAALLPGRPRRPWSLAWGAVAWVVTVAGGMLLRVLAGDTAQTPFVIVATIVLGVFLLGWRALAGLLRRRRSSASGPASRGDAGSTAETGAVAVAAEPAARRTDAERAGDRDGGEDASTDGFAGADPGSGGADSFGSSSGGSSSGGSSSGGSDSGGSDSGGGSSD